MARGQDEFSDMSEARRHLSSHDEDEADAAERDDASPEEEGKSRGRSEGLDTLKSYLREIRRSTLLTFKQEQQLGKRVMAGENLPDAVVRRHPAPELHRPLWHHDGGC